MNFDQPTNRKSSGSLKWDEDDRIIYPLWVADMDFQVAPPIREALEQRVRHGIFGYVVPSEDYYQSIIQWHLRRHHTLYQRDWFITVPGVVPAISAILRALTAPGDGVLVISPVYNCFYSSIANLQCEKVECPLKEKGNSYEIDFELLEQLAAQSHVKVMLLCNPHNPCGRVWSPQELSAISDICLKHNVFVVSDEIHCELVMPGQEFFSYSTLGEEAMSQACICTSASKSFNIAGLQNAQIICPDPEKRALIDRAVNIHEVCDVNPFGVVATKAAYDEGEPWLKALCDYIWKNYTDVRAYIEHEMPSLKVKRLEATYLMWVDIRETGMTSAEFCERLKEEQSVWLAEGSGYGKGGEGHVRINLATQHRFLMEAMTRVKDFVASISAQ